MEKPTLSFDALCNLPDRRVSVEEVPVVHGEKHQLGNLNPTPAQFRIVDLTPLTTFNQGKLENLSTNHLTILLNNHSSLLGFIFSFQCSLEANIKRANIPNEMQNYHVLVNFNIRKSITPSDINETLKGFFTETSRPVINTRDMLTRLSVALIHSQCHQFIIHNLVKLNYTLLYQESIKNPAVKIQPLWIDYCRTAGVAIPGTIKTVSPTEPFHNLLTILGLSDEEKKDMQASVLMLVHLIELDATFNEFTNNLETVKPLSNNAPEQGVSSGLLYVTDYVQVGVRMPNMFSLKHNCTLYSTLNATSLLNQTRLIAQLCSDIFQQKRIRSTTSCGVYLTEFAGTSVINLHKTLLDGLVAPALIICTEIVLPTVTWEDLYHKGYIPHPTADQTPIIRDKKNQTKDPWHSYKHLKVSKKITSSAPFIFTGEYLAQIAIIPSLSPGNETLHERIENLQVTSTELGLHQTIHNLKTQVSSLAKQNTKINTHLLEMVHLMKYAVNTGQYSAVDIPFTENRVPVVDITKSKGPQTDLLEQAVTQNNLNNDTVTEEETEDDVLEENKSSATDPPTDESDYDPSHGKITPEQIAEAQRKAPDTDKHSTMCNLMIEQGQTSVQSSSSK